MIRLVGILGLFLATAVMAGEPIVAIDGDTIRQGDQTIRIMGLDTPETYAPKCESERQLGYRAAGRLQHLLNARKVTIYREGFDKYGRIVARVFVGQDEVSSILIAEGLARPYTCVNFRCPARKPWC